MKLKNNNSFKILKFTILKSNFSIENKTLFRSKYKNRVFIEKLL